MANNNKMQYFELNTGAKIPAVGLGTVYNSSRIVSAAIKVVDDPFRAFSFV